MQIIHGKEIKNHIDELGRFRIEIFREYPYLYEGSLEYERAYLRRYSENAESFLIITKDSLGIVGACTGIPISGESQEFQSFFLETNKNEIYYIGEVMLRPGARGKKLGSRLLAAALSLIDPNQYKKVALCTVDRGSNHPLSPENYCPPDYLWRKFAFQKVAHLTAYLDWKDIGQTHETRKPMNVWFREHSVDHRI